MNTQLVDVAVFWGVFLTYFASSSAVSYVQFKLVNVAATILVLWIQSMVIQSQIICKRASFIKK